MSQKSPLFYLLSLVGFIVTGACASTATPQALRGIIVGYTFFLLTLCFPIIGICKKAVERQKISTGPRNIWSEISNCVMDIAPCLTVISLIFYMFFLLSKGDRAISQGTISKGYTTYSTVFVMILMTIIVTYGAGSDETYELTATSQRLVYFLVMLAITTAIILKVIIITYQTDG